MLAALLSLAIFVAWSLIGLALLAAVHANVHELRVALTAPIVGTAVTVLPLFIVSHAGVSMADGAPPVFAVLLVASIVIVGLKRPRLPVAVAPVLALCVANLLLVGWPMLHLGFRWLADANSDMANYSLAATNLMHHGLLAPLDVAGLAHNRGLSSPVAHGLATAGARPGWQVTLAGFAATLRMSPASLYMPMTFALSMGSICAVGALAMQASRRWWAASIAAGLLAVSPLAAYGVLQGLTPQVWGLGLAVALCAWLMHAAIHERPAHVSQLIVITLLAVAFVVVYIELAAVIFVAYGLYLTVLALQRRVSLRAVLLLVGAPILGALILLNAYLFRELHFVVGSSTGGIAANKIASFGYALVPTALPGIAGLQRFAAPPYAPYMGLSVVVAAVLLAAVLAACLTTMRTPAASSIILLVDFALGIALALRSADFGLFKLYMYVQPFLAAGVGVWLSRFTRRSVLVFASVCLVALVAFQLSTTHTYARDTRDPVALRHASATDLMPAFRHLMRTSHEPVVPVTDNVSLGVLEAASAGKKPLYFVSRNFFVIRHRQTGHRSPWAQRTFRFQSAHSERKTTFDQNVDASRLIAKGACVLALPTGSQGVVNRRTLPEGSPNLAMLRCRNVRNLLAFAVSTLGQAFTIPDNQAAVSLWALQPDYFDPGHTLSGLGRFALFQVLRPTSRVRLELDLTTTSSRSNRLPPAQILGDKRVRFPVVGRGSARLFSPPLRPRVIGEGAYLLLDMGVNGRRPRVPRPGITGLWGRSVPLDPRRLTSYVRNISVVGNEEYRRLRAPSELRSFPGALADPDLQYSGIYEDGWTGEHAYAVLAGGSASALTIRGNVLVGQRLEVSVNGRRIASEPVQAGLLDLQVPVPPSRSNRRVELRFARTIKLQAPDTRRVAALLQYIGLAPRPAAPASIDVPHGLSQPGAMPIGVYADGWLAQRADLSLAGGNASVLTLRGNVPVDQRLTVFVNGLQVISEAVRAGHLNLHVLLPPSLNDRRIELRFARTVKLVAPDQRHAAARLQHIGLRPHRRRP